MTATKERGILFSAPMVRVLLDGSKTQTRRVMKPQPTHMNPAGIPRLAHLVGPASAISCPYGAAGDRLAVRETFFAFGRWETRFSAEKGRDEWHFVDMTVECGREYQYAAALTSKLSYGGRKDAGGTSMWWKRPAIFMPRVASRITLEITGVRVERLQDISEADALAEGIVATHGGYGLPDGSHYHAVDPRISYWSLWEAINGPGSVEANPWVWCVDFEREA